ncbi:transglycosylase SLT domain-containing protein [Rubellimicrobium roseum]|nr:transglycosylase SLT domain-containing protein [Rubellimicrobium roseum]
MVRPLHMARWTLGGTFAVIAGLAASAEPLAPMEPASGSLLDRLAAVEATAATPDVLEPAERPVARVAAQVPVEVAVRSGADLRPEARPVFTGAARWDDKGQGADWSVAAMNAIEAAPHDLRDIVPADIGVWCPGYLRNPAHLRAAFWVGTVSALARYESNFDADAQGGGGAWHGLLQISPATARGYGCDATTPAELHDPEANLQCAIRIMSRTVARDGVVSAGDEGIAADWGPMSSNKLEPKIRDWVSSQDYCKPNLAVMASLIPPVRPGTEAAVAEAAPAPRGAATAATGYTLAALD